MVVCDGLLNIFITAFLLQYSFPRDPARRSAWTTAVGKKNWQPTGKPYICSEHFRSTDFNRTLASVRLHHAAVPSIFPALPAEMVWHKTSILLTMRPISFIFFHVSIHKISLSHSRKTTSFVSTAKTYNEVFKKFLY